MKKFATITSIIFLLTLFGFNTGVVFALSSYDIGGSTYYSDGTSSYNIGNTTYYSDGTSAYNIGNTTYYSGNGSSGSSYNIGNTTYYNNNDGTSGSAYTIGNTTYVNDNQGNSGSSYNIGNTTYYDGDVFIKNSCPSNSSYDSLSSKCKCNYGYSVNSSATSCVYSSTYNSYTAPTTPTCPINSYYDGVSSCKCSYGYVVSGSSCVYKGTSYSNTSTYSETQSTCPLNSHISIDDSSKCLCNSGYQTNSTKTACILSQTYEAPSNPGLQCNGQSWNDCPTGQKFFCSATGNPQCLSSTDSICNGKAYGLCPVGKRFYCPSVGDPQCLSNESINTTSTNSTNDTVGDNSSGEVACSKPVFGKMMNFGFMTTDKCYKVWQDAVEKEQKEETQIKKPIQKETTSIISEKTSNLNRVASVSTTTESTNWSLWDWFINLFK